MKSIIEILLVEDNPGDADLLREMLPDSEALRYELESVTRISEALAYLKINKADLVLLDLGLPDSDGIDTVITIREACADIPIVVLTGNDDEKTGIAAVQAGAQDYLVKGKIPAYHLARVLRYAMERHSSEKNLREFKNKLHSIVDNIGIGVALISPEMEVLEVNRQIRNWFPETTLRLPVHCRDVFCLEKAKEACEDCPTKKTLKDGKVHQSVWEGPSGKNNRAYRIVTSPIHNEEGCVTAAVQMMEDITESLSAEKKLRQALKLESLGTLAGGIAHDFNNILSAILGFTELALEKTPKPGALEDNLREIHRAGLRAAELVRQILSISRKTDAPSLAPLRIDLIIKETLKLLRATLPTSIEIKLSIEKTRDRVIADSTQIHQIIMNLCTNAGHAMEPEGGVLSIKLEPVTLDRQFTEKNPELTPGAYLKFSVSDTGCGMAPDIMESIFDPYFTTKDLGEGTGLGLSLVLGIVRECGGAIFVESEPGKGTTFTLYFPSIKEGDIKDRQTAEAPLPGGTERILVVDDEPAILKVLQRSLEQLGYAVSAEPDGIRALALIQNTDEAIDLVISDMTMPKMSGNQLAVKLKALCPDLPFILCTGFSKLISEEKAAEIGIYALLTKPFSTRKLAETVRRALDEAKRKSREAPT